MNDDIRFDESSILFNVGCIITLFSGKKRTPQTTIPVRIPQPKLNIILYFSEHLYFNVFLNYVRFFANFIEISAANYKYLRKLYFLDGLIDLWIEVNKRRVYTINRITL